MKVLVVISAVLAVATANFAYSSVAPYYNNFYGAHAYSAFPYASYPYSGIHGFRHAVAAPVAAPIAAPVAYNAAPYAYNVAPYAYHGALATKSQYHAQDEFGQASYGHATHDQAHSAVRDAFGGVTGSYSYVNPEGKVVEAHYTADAVHGFRVASNDLPVAPSVPAVRPSSPLPSPTATTASSPTLTESSPTPLTVSSPTPPSTFALPPSPPSSTTPDTPSPTASTKLISSSTNVKANPR